MARSNKTPINKQNHILKCLKTIGYKLCLIFCSILLLFILPIMLILFLPMWIARQVVKVLAKVIRPDLCEMVTCAASSCANVSGSVDNPRTVNLIEFLFEDKADYEQLVIEFNSKAVQKRELNGTGNLQYPELQQYVTAWLGYRFWKQETNFQLKNHITTSTLNKNFVTSEDLRQKQEELLSKPFKEDQSPWEVLVIPNTVLDFNENSTDIAKNLVKTTTTVILRCSHVLADGYSMKKLVEAVSSVKFTPKLKINYPSRGIFQTLISPFKFFYTIADMNMVSFQNFPFKQKDSAKSLKNTFQTSDIVDIGLIREIKDRTKVSFSSVIFGIITGAFRELALRNGIEMTETLPCVLPLPKPGHPEKLTNHFALAMMRLPIGEFDPRERLQICQKQLNKLRSSVYPIVADFFLRIYGSCCDWVGSCIGINTIAAVNVSYLPSGVEQCSFIGVEVIGQTFCIGVQKGSIGAVITTSSFKDRIQFHILVDSSVLPRDKVLEFNDIIKQEVEILRKIDFCDV